LNGLSIDAFRADDARGRHAARANHLLRVQLRQVGRLGDRLSEVRDYEEQLASKVQFVLDALVGLIGIAQNDVFKVLTIVSIVGIPPTLMAGIYGMNFKNMPEYDWAWGYQYGWAVILLSALIPLVWFKVKGWF
jgi:magnesium transporter